jgi:hypothetical protein|tara:strand:+ start:15045 stop:15455 length:411 start_codon:yes stop_codon:yes gene_type:complete
MELNIRKLHATDYEDLLLSWWKDWGWDAPAKDFLPDNGEGGLIVFDEEIPVCAGFVYVTNSKVAWVDWIISNKNYNKKPGRKLAIQFLIESLTNTCSKNGNKYAYALIKHKGLQDVYLNQGYIKGDNYTQEMIKHF